MRRIKYTKRHFQRTINNNSNDLKQLWKGVNLIRGKRSKTNNITSLEVQEEIITGDKNIAEALNSFFVNMDPSLSKELPESQNNYADYLQYSTQNSFTFDEVSENDTLKLLCSLKESKSTGLDKINARLVKDSAEVICPTLTKVFNGFLHQGIFPEDLENATISPIYKNGDKSDGTNYRPVSVLSNVAKILEKIVYNQLISDINENSNK